MTSIQHHIPDHLLLAYASGNLSHPLAAVVATHVSMCLECRAALEAHQMIGGELIEASPDVELSRDLKSSVLDLLDLPEAPVPEYSRSGIYPGPVMEALKGRQPSWKKLGAGVRQCILSHGAEGSVRLLQIPPGMAVPDHGHSGLELTLVLQGSFSDETGHFGVGDIEIADDDVEHTPIADPGAACICLAATEAPLRFNAFLPRLLQPIFRI
ncbi:ChrR family anti-sigma-E factor [Aliiruegeria sabulilitoris]|uniref:ChrR family anti-sigma-E factor n=1 Tax=Aliiruegeria sabulilitoris TaxID=1510458 RepID=UPI00082F9D80|nr:ChrR family anti-sigma-E factor [Aliiruegeria sabulilitoris]NDR59254.1 transcriptional regulator [Pseudoruegeria sp. M32A2M]